MRVLALVLCVACGPPAGPFDADGDGFSPPPYGLDCDDRDPSIHPTAADLPADGIDQDCSVGDRCYVDLDLDGFGGPAVVSAGGGLCGEVPGTASRPDDCDDLDAHRHPETPWYADRDQDGFGATFTVVRACEQPPGFVLMPGDCDDLDAAANPAAIEEPGDSVDADCDAVELCFVDDDGDGWGTPEIVMVPAPFECLGPGVSPSDRDCDDTARRTFPGAPDRADDGVDSDCDGIDG